MLLDHHYHSFNIMHQSIRGQAWGGGGGGGGGGGAGTSYSRGGVA